MRATLLDRSSGALTDRDSVTKSALRRAWFFLSLSLLTFLGFQSEVSRPASQCTRWELECSFEGVEHG